MVEITLQLCSGSVLTIYDLSGMVVSMRGPACLFICGPCRWGRPHPCCATTLLSDLTALVGLLWCIEMDWASKSGGTLNCNKEMQR